jgi:hypothetical protein
VCISSSSSSDVDDDDDDVLFDIVDFRKQKERDYDIVTGTRYVQVLIHE